MSGNNSPPPLTIIEGQAQADTIISWTPIAVVLLAIIVVAVWRCHAWLVAKRATNNAAFETAIGSDKLEVLGGYLRDQLGSLRLDAFADSNDVRDRAQKYLRRLREYLNQPIQPGVSAEEGQFAGIQTIESFATGKMPAVISEAQALLSVGKGWSAFALLRSELERTLRNRGLLRDRRALPSPSAIGPKSLQAAYGVFLRTANRSIHGENIDSDEEQRAMRAAVFLFDRLDKVEVRTTNGR